MIAQLYGGPLDGKTVALRDDTAIYTEFPFAQRGCIYGLSQSEGNFPQVGIFKFVRQMTRDETKRESKR